MLCEDAVRGEDNEKWGGGEWLAGGLGGKGEVRSRKEETRGVQKEIYKRKIGDNDIPLYQNRNVKNVWLES